MNAGRRLQTAAGRPLPWTCFPVMVSLHLCKAFSSGIGLVGMGREQVLFPLRIIS